MDGWVLAEVVLYMGEGTYDSRTNVISRWSHALRNDWDLLEVVLYMSGFWQKLFCIWRRQHMIHVQMLYRNEVMPYVTIGVC